MSKMAVIEDAENLLTPRDERSQAGISNLLNIGDGFLGDYLRMHVLATTNTPKQNLDAAVKRPGRLMASAKAGDSDADNHGSEFHVHGNQSKFSS